MNVMRYDVERCDGYYELCGFLDDANRYGCGSVIRKLREAYKEEE